MPFTEKLRQYWLEVSGNRCQWEYFKGDKLVRCNSRKRLQVHHITPEGVTKARGGNPDETRALVLCENHHVRNTTDNMFEENGSFHPDVGNCYQNYGSWKNRKDHLESISGKRMSRTDMPSPFDEMAKDHASRARRGERYHSGDDRTDGYYERLSEENATRYNTENKITKPVTHRRIKHKPKPTRWEWAKNLFDERK